MITTTLITAVAAVIAAIIGWVANARKNGSEANRNEAQAGRETAEAHARQMDIWNTLQASMINRLDLSEKRQDKLEDKLEEIRHSLYPHQQWDLKAHRTALMTDPDFPPPPDLGI